MTLLKRLVPVVVALVAAISPARALDIDVTSFTLANGMQVVVIPDHRAPVVTHMVWYKVGAADEPQGKAGIAHFLEHLMFKGTPRYPDGAFSRIVRANGGDENAFTSQDHTAYYQRVMKDRLPLVMELEAERLENEPSGLLSEQLDAALFTAHPYGKPVIGWMPEVAALTRQDALDFYRQHYEPHNAILIVAGDVTPDEVKTLAERYYGPLENKRPAVERRRTTEPEPTAERRVIMRDARASSPSWQRQYLTASSRNLPAREELALSLLADIVGGGNQSRLYQKLTVEQKIAAYAGAWFSADMLDYGTLGVYAAPNTGVSVEQVEKAVDEVLAEVAAKGVTQEELDRSRNSVIASATYLLDSQDKLARLFGVALTTGQGIADVLNWEKDMATVTLEDVNEAARTAFARKASVTGILLPEAKAP